MKRLIVLVLVVSFFAASVRAQLLLSPGQTFTYEFSTLESQGDGHPNAGSFAIFYSDPNRSTPDANYTVDLFENSLAEPAMASASGGGTVTARGPAGAWYDLQGFARVTVNSGDVFLDSLVVNVYKPTGFGDYEHFSTGIVAVPEPGTVTLAALGAVGVLGWNLARRRR